MPRLFDPTAYGPAIAAILADNHLSPLGPGGPREQMRPLLASFDPTTAFAPHVLRDRSMAAACHAGLWLYHDFFDESHTLSQGIDTPTGSYWHGILHRREPDAANASYWFRRVGEHPIFSRLAEDARELGFRLPSGRWDPFQFIDLCEQHRDTGTEMEMLLCRVQQREWEHLFAWCYTCSVAGG